MIPGYRIVNVDGYYVYLIHGVVYIAWLAKVDRSHAIRVDDYERALQLAKLAEDMSGKLCFPLYE